MERELAQPAQIHGVAQDARGFLRRMKAHGVL